MKNNELTEKALSILSELNDLVPGAEYETVRRMIKLAGSDIYQEKQSVQFVMNKFYNSIYQLVFREQITLPEKFTTGLKEGQTLAFKNGLFYASSDMRMALYE